MVSLRVRTRLSIAKFKTQARERFIAPSEMDRVFSVLRDETNLDLRDYVYLSLFTGARQANVLGMRWDQVDPDLELWRIPLTKNGLPNPATYTFGNGGVETTKKLCHRRMGIPQPRQRVRTHR